MVTVASSRRKLLQLKGASRAIIHTTVVVCLTLSYPSPPSGSPCPTPRIALPLCSAEPKNACKANSGSFCKNGGTCVSVLNAGKQTEQCECVNGFGGNNCQTASEPGWILLSLY